MIAVVKVHPIHDLPFRREWAARHTCCQCCGIREDMLRLTGQWPPRLETHHIMKFGRSDEATNLLRVCPRDHRIIEGERVPRGGNGYWPRITLGMVLGAKLAGDPEEYDRDRLTVLCCSRHRTDSYDPLPKPEQLPGIFLTERDEKWTRH